MFGFLKKKKAENTPKFDILNVGTWDYASPFEPLKWGNDAVFANSDTGKALTEKEMLQIITEIFQALKLDFVKNAKTLQLMGFEQSTCVSFLLEKFANGVSANDAMILLANEMSKNLKQIQKTIGEYDREQFNILDMDTWNFASSKRGMIWNGKELRNEETGRVNTEKDVVGLARAMFEVLEESCETIAAEKKIEAIKNLLDNIADLEQAKRRRIEKEEEIDSGILDGLFDPRDPETFQYAKRLKPLVIDGVQIYDVYIDEEGMEAKENVTEKRFADGLSLTFKMNSTMPEMTAEEKRERAEKHVRQKVAECTPAVQRNLSVFGGYSFSEAQMEIMDGLSPEKKTKIGEIMSTEKSGRKREQQIRNSLGVDGFWVVKLDDLHDFPDLEEERMQEYFMTYEFDEEDEIHEVFNASPYLKNRPRMKAELTERAIEFLRDEE